MRWRCQFSIVNASADQFRRTLGFEFHLPTVTDITEGLNSYPLASEFLAEVLVANGGPLAIYRWKPKNRDEYPTAELVQIVFGRLKDLVQLSVAEALPGPPY